MGLLAALTLAGTAMRAQAQLPHRADVTDAGRLWLGAVAPPVCPGGGTGFRDRLERRAAEHIVADACRMLRRQGDSPDGDSVAVRPYGLHSAPTPRQRREAVEVWLRTHGPAVDVTVAFTVSARGCVVEAKLPMAAANRWGELVAESLDGELLWIPARRLRGGVYRAVPTEYTVTVCGERLLELIGKRIEADGTNR